MINSPFCHLISAKDIFLAEFFSLISFIFCAISYSSNLSENNNIPRLSYILKFEEPTIIRLNTLKCDFYQRLIRNTYTREILRIFETIEVNQSFISEIDEFKSFVGDDSSLERSEVCSVYKYIVMTDLRASKEDHIVMKIREIFSHMNREEIPKMLFDLRNFIRLDFPNGEVLTKNKQPKNVKNR
ncbi:hypothetical protein BpHYR1_051557 [Brachionus plicatilis]|uniref:Uncharacterized protein n=1 Tax=Brachionus plicatilis TaxID=10195 RepID=A0A3M7RM26_BRAPC|nr:hypothetical protein BpHYR1_051557 [Brachionus plicatilis]